MEVDMRIEDVRIGMNEQELRAKMGAPCRVQLAGASMVYRWQDASNEADASAWLTVRLRRARGQGLAHAIVDQGVGQRDGVRIALP
jgi:hypothetical protein